MYCSVYVGIVLSNKHKYLLPIVVPNDKVTVEIKYDNQSLSCICCEKTIFDEGKHFIEILPGMNNLSIVVTNNDEDDAHVLFEILFKYNYRKDIFGGDIIDGKLEETPKYGIDTQRILRKIAELDVPGKFKYSHIPSVDVRIDDPLDPVSMFNDNHVYNKFTIARAELDSAKPYDASFDIVNNK